MRLEKGLNNNLCMEGACDYKIVAAYYKILYGNIIGRYLLKCKVTRSVLYGNVGGSKKIIGKVVCIKINGMSGAAARTGKLEENKRKNTCNCMISAVEKITTQNHKKIKDASKL